MDSLDWKKSLRGIGIDLSERRMQRSEDSSAASVLKGFSVDDSWRLFRITKHLGGVYATERLIKMCNILPGTYVLDIGCGTGYTACLLAKRHMARVVAADINPELLEETTKRVQREKVSDKVTTKEADAHNLPFPDNTFDVVIAESVLVFCDKVKAATEIRRVLKPGGVFGDTEATYVKPPPVEFAELMDLAARTPGGMMREDEWKAVYRDAGFEEVSSVVRPLNAKEESISAIRVNGLRFITSLFKALVDPKIRGTLLSGSSVSAVQKGYSYMGYGLYVSRKPP